MSVMTHHSTIVPPTPPAVAARGLLAETFSSVLITSGITLSTGILFASLVGLSDSTRVTNIVFATTTPGAGTPPTLFKFGLYTYSGGLVGQSANVASDAALTAAIGGKTIPLTAPATVPGTGAYYLTVLQVGAFGTTGIQLGRAVPAASSPAITPFTGVGAPHVCQTAQTDNPAQATWVAAGNAFWLACN